MELFDSRTYLTAGLIPQTTDVEFGKFIVVTMPSAVFAVPASNHTLRSLAQTDQDATLGYTYIKYSIYKGNGRDKPGHDNR